MKRLLLALFALALITGPLSAQTVTTSVSGPGQLPGTATNDNANAGNVGQILTANCPTVTSTATITVTIATPAVVNWGSAPPFHNTAINVDACPIVFTTTGTLPTGISLATNYWVIPSSISGNTFQIATSVTNALAGTAVATSGTQSGTQTATASAILATGTALSIGGLTIPAGDWDIEAMCAQQPNGATTSSQFICNLSLTDNVLTTTPADNMSIAINGASISAGAQNFLVTNNGRFSFSTPTKVFVVTQATFAVNSMNVYGFIHARRQR